MNSLPTLRTENWPAISQRYQYRIGHVYRQTAAVIADIIVAEDLGSLPDILDNACGTGCVTEELFARLSYARYEAVDIAPWAVIATREILRKNAELWKQVMGVWSMDSEHLEYLDRKFDAIVTNFGINNFEHPEKAVGEVWTLKDDGVAVFTVWREQGWEPLFWEAQRRVQPKEQMSEEWVHEMWIDGQALDELLKDGGFGDIRLIEVRADLWGDD